MRLDATLATSHQDGFLSVGINNLGANVFDGKEHALIQPMAIAG
jgi:hypothetical protein